MFQSYRHKEVQNAILQAGNNFQLTVHRCLSFTFNDMISGVKANQIQLIIFPSEVELCPKSARDQERE